MPPTDSSSSDNESLEADYSLELPPEKRTKIYSKSLNNLALVSDRAGISDRNAALIANAALEDFDVISKYDSPKIIDKNKLRRERSRTRKLANEAASHMFSPIQAVYFDGKKDTTLIVPKDAPKSARKSSIEDHYTLIEEPGANYLGHIKPSSGRANDIVNSIIKFLDEKYCDLVAIGCDGTATNTC